MQQRNKRPGKEQSREPQDNQHDPKGLVGHADPFCQFLPVPSPGFAQLLYFSPAVIAWTFFFGWGCYKKKGGFCPASEQTISRNWM